MYDDVLIKQAQSGDTIAFAQLLEWVYDIIFRFALRWAGNRLDAEDITQTACIKLAGVIGQFRFESAFTSWLYRLVINCANDWRRKERRNSIDDTSVQNFDTSIEINNHEQGCSRASEVEVSAELSRVIAHVDAMGKDYKETLLLVFSEGQSHGQAALILGVKESTISWRIHDIRKRLTALNDDAPVDKENTHD